MTDKCREKMNGGVGYITIEILQREGKDARGVGDPSPQARGTFSLRPLGRPILYVFPPPQNEPSPYQNPTSGPTLYRFIVIGPVPKPQPYKYIHRY